MKYSSILFAAALVFLAAGAAAAKVPAGLDRIEHIVVIYLENRSFDNLYALFPGADGPSARTRWAPQQDRTGKVYDLLPPVPDQRFPAALINAPFLIDQYVPQDAKTPDLVHRFYQNQLQINGGRNDRFAAWSDAGGLVMGFYDGRTTKLWAYAKKYTLADHFFQGAFGGSFLNHFWLVCACTPKYDDAPEAIRAKLDDQGQLISDGAITPDGFAVNTIQSRFQPHAASVTDEARLLPPVDLPTIGDSLSDKGISWAWYSGGWDDALAGKPAPSFQFHHQPFAYFSRYGDGSDERRLHLKDEAELYAAIAANRLPAVSFYKPLGIENQHPGYANITNGDNRAADLIDKIMQSRSWKSTLVIVTYDENGGFWDHVPPPKGDRWGPGTRVPALFISPFARKGYVDHTPYDTTSILKLIELRFKLKPLGSRDARAKAPLGALMLESK
ncbi:MAG TPA: acid phosphatase [Rhodospirillaceae bacterium]|nr:acid phosphatase [Rhodospirillaceae bacterium]